MENNFGFLIISFGKQRYIEQGNTLARSLRVHMPGIPIACVTDANLDQSLYDHIVPINKQKGGNFLQKMWLDEYSPFDFTLFIDADCIVGAPFHQHIENLRNYSFTPVCDTFLKHGDVDKDMWVKDIGRALDFVNGKLYPKFNGGVYYFDKSQASTDVFTKARSFIQHAEELGIIHPKAHAVGDEALYALALASLNRTNLYNDLGGLMRTPVGITGKLHMSKQCGNFSFVKYGKLVAPAICHFAACYERIEYIKAAHFLKWGKISAADLLVLYGSYTAIRIRDYKHTLVRRLTER